ncbi:MAG: sigma-70 family RNA polymerase sigma factor [Planctomycetales bacterium]|nr:sigma-70 family RNA polymerase sigma factor [Planctomycetales bacterium]
MSDLESNELVPTTGTTEPSGDAARIAEMADESARKWVQRLYGGRNERAKALEELRSILLRGLRAAFAGDNVSDDLFEDAVQDSLMKILRNLDSFEGRSRFESWATSIALRTLLSELRHRRYQDIPLASLSDPNRGVSSAQPDRSETSPDVQMMKQQVVAVMHRLIDEHLSEHQRSALRGVLAGIPSDVLANRLHLQRNALYKLLHDARQKLKQGLAQEGYEGADLLSLFE